MESDPIAVLREYLSLRKQAADFFKVHPEIASLLCEIYDHAPDMMAGGAHAMCERSVTHANMVALTRECDQRISSS